MNWSKTAENFFVTFVLLGFMGSCSYTIVESSKAEYAAKVEIKRLETNARN